MKHLVGVHIFGFIRILILEINQINVIIVARSLEKEFIHQVIHSGDYLTDVMNGETFPWG